MGYGFRISTPSHATYSHLPSAPLDPEASSPTCSTSNESQASSSPKLSLLARCFPCSHRTRRRCLLLLIATLLCMSVSALFFFTPLPKYAVQLASPIRFPPTYESFREREENLVRSVNGDPKVEPHRPGVKYFFPEKHVHGVGIGNAIQELFLNALVAYASNRSFVWDDYTWSEDPEPYSQWGDNWIPSRIPLSVLIDGPMVGKPFLPGDNTPRAVTRSYFHEICEVLGGVQYLDTEEVNKDMWWDENYSVLDILNVWVEKLNSMEAACVSTGASTKVLWEYWFFGNRRYWPVWPVLRDSPLITHFSWSPLVLLGIEANKDLLGLPRLPFFSDLQPPISFSPSLSPIGLRALKDEQFDIIPGLLVLHVRRGDFSYHCDGLAHWGSDWQGVIQLATDGMSDAFEREKPTPEHWEEGKYETDVLPVYKRRCYPTIEQIVHRVREIRLEHPRLNRIYVMTNGKHDWLQELRLSLLIDSDSHVINVGSEAEVEELKLGKWEEVKTSRDMVLDWDQKHVSVSVDAAIAMRADVLIGNGWSSLSGDVIMLRMAKGVPKENNRLW